MYDRLDRIARESSTGKLSRRQTLRLLLAGGVAAAGGAAGVSVLKQAAAPSGTVLATAGSAPSTTLPTGPGAAALVPSPKANDCPFPNVIRPLTSTTDCPDKRIPKAGHTPAVNGCGPQGSIDLVPDSWGDWNWEPACNNHDVCYGTCGSDRAACDKNIETDMQAECNAKTDALSQDRAACYKIAALYRSAVEDHGEQPHAEGQMEGCDCCEEPAQSCVFCNCNDTYYDQDHVGQCLDECHVGLGCFTGICEPAPCPP